MHGPVDLPDVSNDAHLMMHLRHSVTAPRGMTPLSHLHPIPPALKPSRRIERGRVAGRHPSHRHRLSCMNLRRSERQRLPGDPIVSRAPHHLRDRQLHRHHVQRRRHLPAAGRVHRRAGGKGFVLSQRLRQQASRMNRIPSGISFAPRCAGAYRRGFATLRRRRQPTAQPTESCRANHSHEGAMVRGERFVLSRRVRQHESRMNRILSGKPAAPRCDGAWGEDSYFLGECVSTSRE